MVLYRLLKDVPADAYCLITSNDQIATNEGESPQKLSGKLYRLRSEFQLQRGYRFGLSKIRERINLPIMLRQRARQMAQILRSERCGAVVACTSGPDLLDLPAAALASRLAGVRFYPYYLDDYYYQWSVVSYYWQAINRARVAANLEKQVMDRASRVIVANEFLGQELQRRYDVLTTVIHNPCDIQDYQSELQERRDDEVKIVYTGAVYDAHYDAFVNLVNALRVLGRPNVKLHIYTAGNEGELRQKGIDGPVVFHPHVPLSTVPDVHRRANILFLPLAFDSPYPELIKTSSPGKLGEYLASGCPILAHVPPDTFIGWYLRKHECGVVVDEKDPGQLAMAIEQILDDASFRTRLNQRAFEQAQSDFSVDAGRASLLELTA